MRTIKKVASHIFIDGFGGMTQGLFATLIIGTMIQQIGLLIGGSTGNVIYLLGKAAAALTSAGIGVGVAVKYGESPLVTVSAAVAAMVGGYAGKITGGTFFVDGNAVLAGPGEPLGAFIAAFAGITCGHLVSGKTKVDIIVTPVITIGAGSVVGLLVGPPISQMMTGLGSIINWATEQRPFIMGIVVSVVMGMVLTLPTNNMNGWTLTLISKNCKYPERAIAFMDYMMSEHGQMLIYLGVEGVTYDIVDGKPVLKEDVSKILNSDRETYDRLYGADDAYWMLQNNVMQLQWEQKAGPATEQLLVWACKYTVYNGQYDVSLSTSPEIAAMDEKCTKLWSETLPKLLLASNEAQFDEIFEEFVGKRNAMGYQEVLKQKTVLMNAAKEKMGISE